MKRILLFATALLILTAGRAQSPLHSELVISHPSSATFLPVSYTAQDSNLNYQNHGSDYALVAGGSKGIGYAIA